MLSLAAALIIIISTPLAKAEPVDVCWYVTDISGTPVDGARLTIYWATSPSGPFTMMPADDGTGNYILDRIAGVRQNPVITAYWNPTYPHGMANSDIHPKSESLNGLYFYVKIEYDTVVKYWPTANSYKPGDPSWTPVTASGSPSGYAAAGPGIGTGPTTAYPTNGPPPPVIPEVPLGPVLATATMIGAFGAYAGIRKRKTHIP
jgi:hypothetical protein